MTKAGQDGAQGDCPFTQYAAMSMQLAGASYKLRPTPQEEKPAWHVDAHGGSMPCWAPNGFADGADAIADSGGIAKHFLAPSATDAAVMEQCGGLFKGIAMLLKNTDDAKDDELMEGLNAQLDKLEACAFTPYLSGAAPASPTRSSLPNCTCCSWLVDTTSSLCSRRRSEGRALLGRGLGAPGLLQNALPPRRRCSWAGARGARRGAGLCRFNRVCSLLLARREPAMRVRARALSRSFPSRVGSLLETRLELRALRLARAQAHT